MDNFMNGFKLFDGAQYVIANVCNLTIHITADIIMYLNLDKKANLMGGIYWRDL